MQITANTTDTSPINYNPYGYSTALIQRLYSSGFNGAYLDIHTQCYHLGQGYRAYSPALRRFTSPDFISPFERGGINAYAYCNGDPVNRIDPNGAMWGLVASWGLAASRRYLKVGMKSPTKPAQQTQVQQPQVQQTQMQRTRPMSNTELIALPFEERRKYVAQLMNKPENTINNAFKLLKPGDLHMALRPFDRNSTEVKWAQRRSNRAYLKNHDDISRGIIDYHNDGELNFLQKFYLDRFANSLATGDNRLVELSNAYAVKLLRKELDALLAAPDQTG